MDTMVLENEFVRKQVHPISVEAYHQLGNSGQISEQTELLEGVIIDKMPKDPIHSSLVIRLFRSISAVVSSKYSVRPENPLTIGFSEPEPDLAIVDYDEKEYLYHHPQYAHLVIEVANTTVALDREKSLIYAKGNIPEYWIMNLVTYEVEVYKNPAPTGYKYREIFSKNDVLRPICLPEWKFSLDKYL
jgi:Uma2 family endonuclease